MTYDEYMATPRPPLEPWRIVMLLVYLGVAVLCLCLL